MTSRPSNRAAVSARPCVSATHDNVVTVVLPGAPLLEHFVGLADAGSGADENLQLADTSILTPGSLQEGLRRPTLIVIEILFCHQVLPDGGPVDIVFLLLLPTATSGEHLNLLAAVARRLRNAEALRALRQDKMVLPSIARWSLSQRREPP